MARTMLTKEVRIGDLRVGGRNPVRIKGMLKSSSSDKKKLVAEARGLEKAGAEALRIAFKEESDAYAVKFLKKRINIPLVADIHFNHRMALLAINSGVDGIRLNPMNISERRKVSEVIREAREAGISIRIGINSGGFRKEFKTPLSLARAMVKKTINYIKLFEDEHFFDIMVL